MAWLPTRGWANADQKADLHGQWHWVLRVDFSGKPFGIVKAVKEVGSGMKGHRRGLVGQASRPKVRVIRVE
ncbi:hypothetical protein MPNT_10227 [Candidatus Methylacidithermus pantelleriae]|uniref:Uncharacterized protein n=1 Tax=Candidatus Methylacidithermus pantelleriae TaxID=2744239 RepID=A0A8J2FMP1_9BACT|nr:hypothetical protein MPNT_10227 [Candidatus Methylacidithermus pantelleriae]